jgi:hypothetical protein
MKKPVKKSMGGKTPAPKPVGGGMSRPSKPGKGMMQRPVTPGRGTTPIGGGRPGDFMATTDQGLRARTGPMPIGGGRLAPPPQNQGLPDGQASMMPNPFYPVPRVGGGSPNVKSEVNLRVPVKGGVSGLRSVNPLKKGGAAKKTTKGMKKK